MNIIKEGKLEFSFPVQWNVIKYDNWIFYRNQFQKICNGVKAVDFIAIDREKCLWLIEVKDYRRGKRDKTIDLAEEIAIKAKDSLAGLIAAQVNANDTSEKDFAVRATKCQKIKLVLHLEQPAKQSKLYPRAINPANIQQKLKQVIKAIDAHPIVTDLNNKSLRWTVQSAR